ncbi:hypothetical protein [Kribbella sp. NPDC004875]|uniref:hypothetical protein n=1 Tax=Kribbella sp. NPDC004875 TaxID=3364107 RepID=UPI003675BF04
MSDDEPGDQRAGLWRVKLTFRADGMTEQAIDDLCTKLEAELVEQLGDQLSHPIFLIGGPFPDHDSLAHALAEDI